SSGAGTRADCIMPPPAHAPRRSASAAAFTPSGTLGGRGAYEQRTENGNREQRMPEKTPEGPLFHSNSNSLFEFSVPARRIAAPVLQLGLRLRLGQRRPRDRHRRRVARVPDAAAAVDADDAAVAADAGELPYRGHRRVVRRQVAAQ